MDVRRTKGSGYNINYPLVWCPKYRRPILTGQGAIPLRKLLDTIVQQYGFELLACEVMPDHVHLCVSAPPRLSPAALAKLFKGITSRRLAQALSERIRQKIWKPGTLWSPSYYVGTAGNVSADVIQRYISACQNI